jgi:hypothetical protein
MSFGSAEAAIYVYVLSGVDTAGMIASGETTQDVPSPYTTMSSTLTSVNGDMELNCGQIAGTTPAVSSFTANGGQTSAGLLSPTGGTGYHGSSYKAATTTSVTSGWTYAPSLTFNAIYRAVVVKAGASGTTVAPAAASMTFTGSTPTVGVSSGTAVSPTAGALAFTGSTSTVSKTSYTWYSLPAPGSYDNNSILVGQTYPTGSILRVVTDFAHITAVYATGPLQNDINDYATAETGYTGSDSATYEIKNTSGTTSQYTITVNIDNNKVIGYTAGALVFTPSTPGVVVNKILAPAAASLAFTGATPTVTAAANRVASPIAAAMHFTGVTPTLLLNGQVIGGSEGNIRPNKRPYIKPNIRPNRR